MTEPAHVTLVAGGAQGIGRAVTVDRLATGGAVVALDVDRLALEDLAAWADETGGGDRLATHVGDVADEGDVGRSVALAVEAFGRLDAVVAVAGIGAFFPLRDLDLETWRRVLDVNLTGVWLCNRAALGPMRAADFGRIVNIASIAGKEGNPKLGPYSASKAGVIGMTKSLAKEVADTGIRIHSVAPAVIHTPMLDQVNQETIDYMVSKIPVGRTGTCEEVAALVHYLSAPECSFTTGACFDISGGRATY